MYKQLVGDSPLTDQISCHILLAKSVGFTNSLGFIWSFFSLIEYLIFSIKAGNFSFLGSKLKLTSCPCSSFILFPVSTFTQTVSWVSVAIIMFAPIFFATSNSCFIALFF